MYKPKKKAKLCVEFQANQTFSSTPVPLANIPEEMLIGIVLPVMTFITVSIPLPLPLSLSHVTCVGQIGHLPVMYL